MGKKIDIVGKRNKANNGQWMEIIEACNASNITVRFEDGTIVYNKKYNQFQKGAIGNPNCKTLKKIHDANSKIGETIVTKNGLKMEIINYINSQNITIKINNDTILYNQNYNRFKRGLISTTKRKKCNLKNRIGETNIATNGQKMKIIAYRSATDMDILFEEGTIVYHKCYVNFKRGKIENPNYKIAAKISCNEFVIYWYLRKYGFIKPECGSLKELGFGQMELDCYHPDYKIAIEYDGTFHAVYKSFDIEKNKICKQNEITIIRIREPKCPILNDNSIEYQLMSNKRFSSDFESTLKEIFKYINSVTDLNINENISFEQDKELILKEYNDTYINKYTKLRLGETNIASNGQKMKIIVYREYRDIDVQFEDGTIVKHKQYIAFQKGTIKNPNYNPYNKVEEKREAKNGQKMTIIAYRGCLDIDVQFEDGTIVTNKSYGEFKKGNIKNPNFKKVA